MSGPPTEDSLRVQVHPGAGVVGRRGDTVLVVPALPASPHEQVRDLLELCHRQDPTGSDRVAALRALLGPSHTAALPGFGLVIRTGHAVRVLVHGPVRVLVDGRASGQPADGPGQQLAEHVVEDDRWHALTVAADGDAPLPDDAGVLPLDLESGTVPGAGVTLHRVPAGRVARPPAAGAASAPAGPGVTTSSTALRPLVQFRTVPLGECAARVPGGQSARGGRRPPLPVAGDRNQGPAGAGRGPDVLVEGVHCPAGHFTDPELAACTACGTALPPGGPRVTLPRPPLGVIVTDGGTIYAVTGDFVIGREAEHAPEVLEGRARPLPLRDAARSTSRVHARLAVRGWKVLLSDSGSANGTLLSRSGAAGPWLPVTTRDPVALVHGDRMRLGKRQLLFDTWRESIVPPAFR